MALRHLHLRKRISKTLEPYPARTFTKRLLDKLVFAVGVVGPLMTIPQMWLIFAGRNAAGVSAVAWFGWALMDVPWIIYGVVHKEPPITLTYALWFLGNLAVAVGAVIYG
jgi:MtN3 and saliva related transmembrane protein